MSDNSGEESREYLPVHPDLKVYSIQEFYSVPAQYLVFLEQDMQTYGELVKYLQSIKVDSMELDSILMRLETRIDGVWNRYLNYIREGAAQVRIIQLRDINRKIWYATRFIGLFLTSGYTLEFSVLLRRMEFIINEIEDVADSIKNNNDIPFDPWQRRLIIRIHKII